MKNIISLILIVVCFSVKSAETVDSISDKVCESDSKCKALLKNLELSNVTQRMAVGQYHMVKAVYEKLQNDKEFHFSGFSHDQSFEIVKKLNELNDKLDSEQNDKSKLELEIKRNEFFKIEGKALKAELDSLEDYFLTLPKIKVDNLPYENINQAKDNFFKYHELVKNIDDTLYVKKIKSQDYISPDDWLIFSGINKFNKGSHVEQDKENFRRWLKVVVEKAPQNKILFAFYSYLKSLPPILDNYEKVLEAKIEKEHAEKITLDKIEKERRDKISSSPDCLKMHEFLSFCDIKQQIVLVKDKIDYENQISKRSGTSDKDRVRSLTKILVSQEEGLSTAKKKFDSIKSNVINLNDCNLIKTNVQGVKIELDEHSISKIRKVLKDKCEVGNYEPTPLYN